MFQYYVDLIALGIDGFCELKWQSIIGQLLVLIPKICLNLGWKKFLRAMRNTSF
jgi:hypothetical protein